MLIDPWDIQLLGTLTLRRRDLQIDRFPTYKTGLLLGYLAAYPNRIHTREALMELYWPDSDPQAGRVSLRQALTSLRRLLEPPDVPTGSVLIADRTHVSLNPGTVRTDQHAFERAASNALRAAELSERILRLQEAVQWYGGPFLEGAYEEWVLDVRHHLQTRYLEILLHLTDALIETDRLTEAEETARRMLEIDSLQEEVHSRLIQIYAARREFLKARRQYHSFHRQLADELGLEPSAPVQLLYRQLEELERQPAAPPPVVSHVSAVPQRDAPPLDEPGDSPRLPSLLTRFFGRHQELAQIAEWFRDPQTRLITLTGPGGIGKTRLAVEAARRAASFGSAITFVSLADLRDPDQILPAILQAMRLPSAGMADPLLRLAAALERRPHLLLLDNYEHLTDAGGAETALMLLERIEKAVLLVTSRQTLNLPGEHELALSPLPTPSKDLRPEALIANPNVQMLMDRMRMHRPDFQVTPLNAPFVAALCERLEGLPLAVELMAGWSRDLTVRQMLERMDHRFDLLISRQRGVSSRHQSLWATVDWSYQMLPPTLQRTFRQLSVFRGGWTQETATVVLEESEPESVGALMHDLRTLQERSLIFATESRGRMRYGMLETLREFGQEKLAEEARQTRRRHAMRFLALAQEANAHLHGPQQVNWLDCLEEEQENMRAALDHWREDDPLLGLRLANALYWFWYVRGYYHEGEERLTELLDRCAQEAVEERARGLLAAGHLANCQSNNAAAFARYEAARRLFEQIGDAEGIARTLCMMGNAAHETLEVDRAIQLCSESVVRYRALNSPSGLTMALFYLANILSNHGDLKKGMCGFQEALRRAEAQGDIRFQSILKLCIGECLKQQGRYKEGLSRYREALAFQRTLREPLPLTYLLRALVTLAIRQERFESAARLLGAMTGLRRKIGYPEALHEKPLIDSLHDTLRARLPLSVYESAMQEAQELDFTQCLEMACLEADRL